MVFPSPISSEDVNGIRERLIQEYRQFPSNLKRDGTAEMNIGSGEETRYVLELLQNADDAQFPGEGSSEPALEGKLTFVITPNFLYCANTGYPLTVEGLKALCDSFLSTKTRSKPTIGFKGIGYKSVLGITESPSIFWHNGCVSFSKEDAWNIFVKIVPNITKEQIPILRYPIDLNLDTELNKDSMLKELWKTHTTVFRLPFRNGIKTEEVWARLREVTPSTLLFTHHLAKVEIQALNLPYGSVSFDIIRKHMEEMEHTVIITDGIKSSWLVIREVYSVPDSERPLFPRDTQDIRTVEVAAALEVDESKQSVKPYNLDDQFPRLHVFFPTDQIVPFRILLHGNFRTNIDRRTVTDDPFNRFIVSKAASLIATKVIETITDRIESASELLDFFEQPSLDNWFQKTLSEKVIELIKTKPIIRGDGTIGWLTPAEALYMPLCIDGTQFRKLVPSFEFKVKSEWRKTCTEEAEKGMIRRRVLMAFGAAELDPLELPRIIEGYNRADPAWVGESYTLLEKTYNYMLTNADSRHAEFLKKTLAAKLLLTSDSKFVQATLPREEGIIFAPPESEVVVLTPPKTRLRFLERKSLQAYLSQTGKTFRQCFLHEKLGVKEYATDDVITGAIVPEIREFWQKRPALTHFDPKKMLSFLLDLLGDILDADAPKFNLSRNTGTLALQSLPVPVKHRHLYAQAYKVYFPKEWTGTDDLEEIYGLGESYFLDLPLESFPQEKRSRGRRLLEALGVSTLPKVKEQFPPDQYDDWRQQSTWDKSARSFPRSPHAALPGWNEYCREVSSLFDQDSSKFDYRKASTLALQSSYELDRFDMIVKDRRRAEHLLKLIATNRAYFDQYLYCDVWYIISRVPDSKKFPSYFAWQLKHTPWIPTISYGKPDQEFPGKAYLNTPSLRRLFRDTIPYVSLPNELKPQESHIYSLLRNLGVRESIDQLEPSDWWKVAVILPSAYKDRLNEAVAEEEVRAVYRAMLDRQDYLENDIPERMEFIKEGKLLATKGKELDFTPATDVWYTEVDRYEQLFDLPIFTIKRQYNRGAAISHVFNLQWIENKLVAKENMGPEANSISELLNNLLSEVAPFFLSRLSVEIAVSTQEQVISRLRKLRFSAVDGLTVEYTLKTEANTYHEIREEPLLLKSEGEGYTLIVNTKVLPVFSSELPIEAAHKIGTELASFLRLSSGLGYEFAELLRKSESDRFTTLASAFGIKEETIEHFRNTFNDEFGVIEIVIPEVENRSHQKTSLTTPYQTLEPQTPQPVRVWNLDDLQFGSVQTIESVNGSTANPASRVHHYDTGPSYLKDEELKKAIETTGQQLVEKWLGTVGGYTNVKDVHTENKGWDVEATKDGTTFFFEVKSSGSNVNIVEITMPEWQKAQAKREKYYLVQVTNLAYTRPETAKYPELLIIRNPYNVLAANPTRFRVRLSEFRRFNALEVKRILTLNDLPDKENSP